MAKSVYSNPNLDSSFQRLNLLFGPFTDDMHNNFETNVCNSNEIGHFWAIKYSSKVKFVIFKLLNS